MDKKECRTCGARHVCRDSALSWIFLFIGIIATVAMRLVALFMHLDAFYAKLSWYVGVSFFFLFFIYRYNISRSRARRIENNELMHKIKERKPLKEEDFGIIAEILCSLTSKKEMINFAVIFVLSGITLILAIVADLIKYTR